MINWQIGVSMAFLAVFTMNVPSPGLRAQEASLADVLARAAEHVTEFRRQLSGIVAEESYEQRAATLSVSALNRFPEYREERLTLRSDFLLVQPEGEERYIEFRDVFEVNGRPVRDRQERLTRLFLDRSTRAALQIQSIIAESARYNIGDVQRTLNTPTLAQLFLLPANQPQVKFSRVTDDTSTTLARGWGQPTGPAGLWVIAFEEIRTNTLIRGRGGKDMPSQGRFWIEPETGRALVTEIVVEDREVRATIDVRYDADPVIGSLVPVEMRERYQNLRNGSRVDGTATYSRFRRFQVKVEETAPVRN